MTLHVGIDGRTLSPRYHGIGRVVYELTRRLADVPDFRLTIFVGEKPDERFDLQSLTARSNVDVCTLRAGVSSVTQYLSWYRLLAHHPVDVLFCGYHIGSPLTSRCARVSMIHDCIIEDPAHSTPKRTLWPYKVLTWAVTRRSRICTVSRSSADAISSCYGLDPNSITVIPNAASATFLRRCATAPAGPSRPGLPDRYVLHVGAGRPHKNVSTLLRAIQCLPDMHLVLVGGVDVRFKDGVSEVIRECGVEDRVHRVSSLSEEELAEIYRGATALVYPSLVEGFGLPAVEAMAAGVPMILSDIPAFREIAGDAAFFVPPTAVDQWAAAIGAIDEDPPLQAALAALGTKQVTSFSWDESADRLAEVLRLAARDGVGDRGRPCDAK